MLPPYGYNAGSNPASGSGIQRILPLLRGRHLPTVPGLDDFRLRFNKETGTCRRFESGHCWFDSSLRLFSLKSACLWALLIVKKYTGTWGMNRFRPGRQPSRTVPGPGFESPILHRGSSPRCKVKLIRSFHADNRLRRGEACLILPGKSGSYNNV